MFHVIYAERILADSPSCCLTCPLSSSQDRQQHFLSPPSGQVRAVWQSRKSTGILPSRNAIRVLFVFGSLMLDKRGRMTLFPSAVPPKAIAPNRSGRSEERSVGKECVSTGRSRWSQYH